MRKTRDKTPIEHEETTLKGNFEIFIGVEVECLEDVPVEVLIKILPPAMYAVFTLKGQQITADWGRMICNEWMPGSGYQRACNSCKKEFLFGEQRIKKITRLGFP